MQCNLVSFLPTHRLTFSALKVIFRVFHEGKTSRRTNELAPPLARPFFPLPSTALLPNSKALARRAAQRHPLPVTQKSPLCSLASPSPPFSMPASRQAAQKLTGPAARAVTQKLGADEYFSGPADVQRMLKSRSALASPRSRTDHPRMWRLEGRKKNIAGESSHQILPAWQRAFRNERITRRRGGGGGRGRSARERREGCVRARARVGSLIRRGDQMKQTPVSEEGEKNQTE